MHSILQDVRYALRSMRQHRSVTAIALFSLAIGVGPAAAMFSVIDELGYRPLAIRDPERLLRLYTADQPGRNGMTAHSDYAEIRSRVRNLGAVAAWRTNVVGVTSDGHAPDIGVITSASDGFFPMLGVTATAGRLFRADETAEGRDAHVAIISDAYWMRRYQRSPEVLGSHIRLNTAEYTIVGVLPAAFRGIDRFLHPDIWVPLEAEPPGPQPARDRRLDVIAHLRDGATVEQAQAELGALAAGLAAANPAVPRTRTMVIEFEAAARRRWVAPIATALLAIPVLVLLIACANVAGLLVGRTEARRAEIATRLALGAGRRRLLRQFLTESALLGLLGGTSSLLVAFWTIRALPALIPDLPLPVGLDLRLDVRVGLFAMAAGLLAVPLFGLAPACFASRSPVMPILKTAGADGGRLRRFTFRNVLTVGQIAASLTLLVIAGLLVRSLLNSGRVDVGFTKRPMILSTIAPGVAGYDRARTGRFYRELLDRLATLPSVESATLARHMPLNSLFGGGASLKVRIPGDETSDGQPLGLPFNVVDENYFTTMGIRIVRGRAFTSSDRWPGVPVALVNQAMVRRYFPDGSPIGRSIELTDRGEPDRRRCEIVGVVEDGKYVMLGDGPTPYVYLPFRQHPLGEATVIARTRGAESQAMEDFRATVRAIDPAMPTMQIVTLAEHMNMALMFERTAAILVGSLGALALVLALVGLYGVVAFIAARRTREIGIRMALGARPNDVLRGIVKQAGGFAAAGIALGLVGGTAAARLIRSMLHGVSSADPLTYAGASVLVLGVALAATWFPARRAARIDPVAALRRE